MQSLSLLLTLSLSLSLTLTLSLTHTLSLFHSLSLSLSLTLSLSHPLTHTLWGNPFQVDSPNRSKFLGGISNFRTSLTNFAVRLPLSQPGGNPGANIMSISQRCHQILVAFV